MNVHRAGPRRPHEGPAERRWHPYCGRGGRAPSIPSRGAPAPLRLSSGRPPIRAVDRHNCLLYELYRAFRQGGGSSWEADSGAIWDLKINDTHPLGWTSADAAGLPIFPGLVRYEEAVTNGVIPHALRFTVAQSQKAFVAPATHYASSSTSSNRPPMGLRLRRSRRGPPGRRCGRSTW